MSDAVNVELVGGPRDGQREHLAVVDGTPPVGVQHRVMSSLGQTLEHGTCVVGAARYRRRAEPDPDGVWRYDYDAAASTGGLRG